MTRVLTIVRNALLIRPNRIVLVVGFALTLLIILIGASPELSDELKSTDKEDKASIGVTYESTLSKLDQSIKAHKHRVEKHSDSWLITEWLANAFLERARLTGQFDHYAEADAAMKQAARVSNSPRNIALSRAGMNYTLHRLKEVEIDLQEAERMLLVSAPTQRRIDELRADVALQQGRYDVALSAFKKMDEQFPSTESAFRLANYYLQESDDASFEQWMIIAAERVLGQSFRVRAWLNLQLGIADLGRGRYDDALAHYSDALTLFPGYWLIEEHIAEIDVIQGRLLLAKTKYQELIQRTDSPLFRIALAEVLQMMSADGTSEDAMRLIEAAKNQLDTMVKLMPESMAGHALEVSLQLDDPEKALTLAEHNHKIRPDGGSSVLLAQAYTLVDEVEKAEKVLQSVFLSPFRSSDLFATASVVSKLNGQLEQAEVFSKSAVALKHDAMDDVEWLANSSH